MKRKAVWVLTVLFILSVVLTGCAGSSSKFSPDVSSIYIKADGTVVSADVESFSGSNYSEYELLEYVERAVKEYNYEKGAGSFAYKEEKGDLPVAIEELTVEEGIAYLYLTYADCEDYLEFTGTDGTTGSLVFLSESTVGESDLSGRFTDADGDAANMEDVTKDESLHVVTAEGPVRMQVEGKVKYVSEGVTVESKNTVVTSEDGVSYIIFK